MARAVPLAELREEDRATFGGKAVGLGRMACWGLPVPDGVALAFDAGRPRDLCEEDRREIRRAYASLAAGGGEAAVAVRSSAVGEDEADFSFAGLHLSRLGVVGEDAVVEAVADCLASGESERARAYRAEADLEAGAMGVVIQRMVEAEHAGLCFTRSPAADDEVVVECVNGLAEGLAAGTRTPSRISFARDDLAERSRDDAASVLERFGVEGAREVARLALAAEDRFGHALDVEWAAAAGVCHLVQARPITAALRLAQAEEIRSEEIERLAGVARGSFAVWTDFSVADMFAHPTPLDVEIVKGIARRGGGSDRAVRRFGLHPADPDTRPTYEAICGRVYLSLDGLVAAFDEDLPVAVDARRLPAARDLALDPLVAPFELAWPGWRRCLRLPGLLLRLARAALRFPRVRRTLASQWEESVRPRVVAEAAQLRERDLVALSNRELWGALHHAVERIVELVYYHQLTDIVAIVLHRLLSLRLGWLYGDGAQAAEARLTTALSGNLNTETNLDLARVARGDLDRATFLERYGHRGNPDWQISASRWREDSAPIDAMLAAVAQAPRDPVERFEEQTRVRAEAERDFEAALGHHPWLRLFRKTVVRDLQAYQRYSPQRETTQGLCYLFVELARNAVLEAARRSDLGELVFHFTLPELESWLVRGPRPEHLERVRERRRRWRAARTLYVPHLVRSDSLDAIGRTPPFPPDARRLEGQVVASGTARGPARVVQSLDEARSLKPGEILVAASADPAWTPLFLVAGGAILEQGGLLSHPAIVAREYGLPAVVNVAQATRILRTGQLLTVDADRGVVVIEEEGGSLDAASDVQSVE